MSKALRDALRAKYKTPQAALKALGLDAALLASDKAKDDAEEKDRDDVVKDKKGMDAESAREFLKGKLSEDDMEAYDALCSKGMDDEDDDKKKGAEDGEEDDDDKKKGAEDGEEEDDKVSKKAMDSAISAAVAKATRQAHDAAVATQKAIREAEEAVRPYVGKLALAHDSAADVYRTTFKVLGVDVKGVDPSAFPAMLKLVPKPDARRQDTPKVAMDAAGADSFSKMFPGAVVARAL